MKSLYLKSAIWDFVLTAIASVSLTQTLLNGFYIDTALQYSPFPAAVVVVCMVALFLIASQKKFMLIGGIAFGAVVLLSWVVSASIAPAEGVLQDSEDNYLIFMMVSTLTATLSFLLTRNRVGTAFYFIVGAFLLGFIELFYERNEIVWAVLFVLSVLALLVYKNYLLNLRTANSVERISFPAGAAIAAVAAIVAVGLGLLVWLGIAAAFNPAAVDLKLITEYRALETVQVRGTSTEYQTPNLDTTSDQVNDDVRTTDDEKEDASGERIPATGDAESDPDDGQSEGAYQGLNLDSLQDAFDMQSHPQNWPLVVALFLPIVAVVMYFVLRRSLRTRRLNQMRELGPEGEFEQLFLFVVAKFKRLRIEVPNGQTMNEFAVSTETAMYQFNTTSGVKFADLARSFSSMMYGVRPVSDEDVANMEKFYLSFWRAARQHLGNFKYFFRAFRL